MLNIKNFRFSKTKDDFLELSHATSYVRFMLLPVSQTLTRNETNYFPLTHAHIYTVIDEFHIEFNTKHGHFLKHI